MSSIYSYPKQATRYELSLNGNSAAYEVGSNVGAPVATYKSSELLMRKGLIWNYY